MLFLRNTANPPERVAGLIYDRLLNSTIVGLSEVEKHPIHAEKGKFPTTDNTLQRNLYQLQNETFITPIPTFSHRGGRRTNSPLPWWFRGGQVAEKAGVDTDARPDLKIGLMAQVH
ncbi:MAG: hypothetical protein O7E52_12275 [Candidatus Poribacteria bacterium]|nr:hypothetical protein [Candidatus Poribacteria bacterium]